MLKPKYLEQLPLSMIDLFSQVEQDILADMARRISEYDYWIPAVEHQRRMLIEMGNFNSYVLSALSTLTGKTQKELKRLMEEAGQDTLAFDVEIYKEHGLDPPPLAASKELQAIINAGWKKTNKLFKNLTGTTAKASQTQFVAALDRAWLQINSGGFDSNTAIRNAIKQVTKSGLHAIDYPSGHSDTIEVAVRRAVVTGVNQTSAELQLALASEMGCDLVEVTAHAGARPEHAVWQGKIYSISGKHSKYPSLREATGYGTGAGLCGWNCRHSFHPYFEGTVLTYSADQLAEYNAPKYTYNGQKLSEYEATQIQRYHERQIRRWKRERAAMEAGGQSTSEANAKVRNWQAQQRDFIEQTGLKRQYAREQIA